MNGQSNVFVWVVVAIVVIGGGWWLLSQGNSVSTSDTGPIKIGFIGPLTGDAATYGQPFQQTVQLAVDQLNAKGGIGGRQVEIIYEDGKCNGQDAVSAAQKLVNVDGVQAIIGGFCSGETLPVVPIAEQGKVLLLSPGASSPALTGISHYFLRDYPSDATQGKVMAGVATSKGWHTVAFIQEQTDYAAGLYKAFSENFNGAGQKILNEAFPSTATDFRSILTKLKGENPDAVYLDAQTAASADRILKQMSDLGWKPQIILSDAVAGDATLLSTEKSILEGALTAEFIPSADDPKFKQFVADFKAKFNGEIPYANYMACVYDAVNLLAEGISQVGYSGSKLADWSRSINNYQGTSGLITIQQNGDRAGGHVPEVIRNGKKEPLN